ncbi:MAG TPA: hypothetical protein VJ846_01840 [Sphingomicrobium sp.]|nr:hypothetical protein [Sphingomicrobium sp.]
MQLPHELMDPQSAMKLAAKLQALSDAVMHIRVGEISAAIDGREASPRERNMTIGDFVRKKDPDFDRQVQEKVASIGPKIIRGMQTAQRTLPQVMRDVDDAQRSVERAVSNLPDPTYPRR